MAAFCTNEKTVIVIGAETTEVPPEVAVKVTVYAPIALTLNVVVALAALPKVAVVPAGLLTTFHW
jgi:hypothetical protein